MKNALLTLAALCFVMVSSAQGVEQVLTAPFADPGINLQQGTTYMDGDPHLGGGLDYVDGPIDQSAYWVPFAVLASHRGMAIYQTGYNGGLGNYVTVTLDQSGTDPDYQTIYAHLDSSPLPVGVSVEVSQGDFIGVSGNTGTEKNHLHFVFKVNGTSTDPYDVYDKRTYYPENGGSCGNDVYWVNCPPQKVASALIDSRKSATLDNVNPYGWSQSPATICGTFASIYWWHGFDGTDLYFADGTSKRCYVSVDEDNNDGGIVYDVLGGAHQAFYVGWEDEWDQWEVMDISCGSCPNPAGTGGSGEGGPQSCLGMPITNRYEESSNIWRQDFQKGYIVDGDVYCYGIVNNFNTYAPGWTDDGWNSQYSYIFTDCYDRNGARVGVGCALQEVTENWINTDYHTQRYDFGTHDQGMIVYDPKWYIDDNGGDNKAYYVYGGFYDAFAYRKAYNEQTGSYDAIPWFVGAPVADRSGNTQQFKYGYMEEVSGIVYVYDSNDELIWNTPAGAVMAAGEPEGYFADHSMAMVSGDFDNDGTVNDLACIYDYDDTECRIHTWCSNGDTLIYSGPTGWWYCPTGYPAEFVRHAVAGDFDGDGYKDDIAALYDYGLQANGKYRSCWHVWLGTGSSFVYQGVGLGWWIMNGYNANLVIDAAAGDFDEDGDDDIATLYDYPGDTCAFHIWLSTGDSLVYQGSQGWWYLPSGYPSQNVKFMIAGDFDYDGDDDLATFYDYGWTGSAYRTRIHVWTSTGDSLIYQGGGGWWTYDGYNMDKVTQVFAGDFNADNKIDVATLYDYGWIPAQQKYQSKIHVWFSTGSAFSFQNIWWNVYGYNAQDAWYGMSAYLNGDSYADIVTAYDYSDGDTTRLHVWLSDGDEFVYQGGGGWWQSFGYPLPKPIEEEIAGIVPESFEVFQNYPNPFNASTIISYALPEASHVSIEVYNILGQRVKMLYDGYQGVGRYQMTWDATGQSSGIYFYRIQTASVIETKKMILLK